MFFVFAILLALASVCCVGADLVEFDRATANTSVWLSAAAYCETDTLLAHNFSGYSTGFTTRYVIEAPEKDVQVV